jgi:3-deoxy-manno-octulosonate cytidylyltransferase (CMP-KDO synthetase)
MTAAILVPARYSSSRFPGKPLALIKGSDGVKRTLIEHSWRAACEVSGVSDVYVVTDDERISDKAHAFGAQVIMTSVSCLNGTERCAEALAKMAVKPEIVVNLQGDAPLTPPWFVEDLIEGLSAAPDFSAATPVLACDPIARERLLNDRRQGRVGGTTAVFGNANQALYFSKEVLPYGTAPTFHHVGVYAYRPNALARYQEWPEGVLEKSEGLEQLRFLENGERVLCVEIDAKGREFWEVNNPEDIEIVEKIYAGLT